MSKHEVVDAYLKGRIDRREFVRRLTLAGVSTAAAVAYAQTLSTSSAAAAPANQGAHGLMRSQTNYTPTPSPVTGGVDTDGDGFTDEEELACGSDPNDPNSTCDNVKTPSGLPNTGAGGDSTPGSGGGSDAKWLAPLAVAGAGAAFLARGMRRAPKPGE
jgi:hypothetical protein